MNIRREIREFGRKVMAEEDVRGVKFVVFHTDGTYTEYNNNFDPQFDEKVKNEQ